MDEFSTTSDNLGQTDEEILTYAASDEALEAAAGGRVMYPDTLASQTCNVVVYFCR